MAKSKPPAGEGHNSDAVELARQKGAILTVRVAGIRSAQAEAEKAEAVLKAARKKVSDAFKKTTMDVGATYTRKFVVAEILEPLDRVRLGGAAEYEDERRFARATFRFPEDESQGEFVLEDTAAEQVRWRNLGFLAGKQGLERDAPDTCPDILVAEYEHAWADGQKALGEDLLIEQEAMAARKAPPPEQEKAPEPEEIEADLDRQARALGKSGFMDTSAPSTETLQAAE